MDKMVCKNCKHFRQHYVKPKTKFVWVNCGHCVYPKLKSRRPTSPVCPSYEEVGQEEICGE